MEILVKGGAMRSSSLRIDTSNCPPRSPFRFTDRAKKIHRLLAVCVLALVPAVIQADSFSFTGTLSTPTDVFQTAFALASPATIGLQTWGFGGGTNAAGTPISAGGTDPFLAIFSGTGGGATILTDASSNPYGTSLDLSNYGSFEGCGPGGAGEPTIGGSAVCGDITMDIPLPAGTYTVVLTDGNNPANAVSDNGTLGEGFNGAFTGGIFCNLSINGADCPNTSGAYAFDITGLPAGTALVPEPAHVALLGTVLLGLALITSSYKRRKEIESTPYRLAMGRSPEGVPVDGYLKSQGTRRTFAGKESVTQSFSH